jgi:hypothetical protein
VKPVLGTDGSRVPLLRAGLDSSRPYTVSFVYSNSGSRFTKSGTYDMGLPRLDIPVNLLTWEVSLPDRLVVKEFGGNALPAELFPIAAQNVLIDEEDDADYNANLWSPGDLRSLQPGQVSGIIVDPNGAVVPNAQVTVSNTQTGRSIGTQSDAEGRWTVSGMQPGAVRVVISAPGFKDMQQDLQLQASRPARMGTTLEIGNISESVTVTADGATLNTESARLEPTIRKNQLLELTMPSQNVLNLQRKVAGILPVRIDVPRSGRSYRFVRPLVVDEETRITFQYKSR